MATVLVRILRLIVRQWGDDGDVDNWCWPWLTNHPTSCIAGQQQQL